MSDWAPLPEWAKAPAHCLACGKLSYRAAGLDAEGDLVCPECDSIDVYVVDVADGVLVIPEGNKKTTITNTLRARLYQEDERSATKGPVLGVAEDAIEYAEQLEHALTKKRAAFEGAAMAAQRRGDERDEARAERDRIATLLVSTLKLAIFEPLDAKDDERMDDLVENARQALREIGTVDYPSWWDQERDR